jgi:hypothetical protein
MIADRSEQRMIYEDDFGRLSRILKGEVGWYLEKC